MCTLGVVFEDDRVHTFKQCDRPDPKEYYRPVTRHGNAGNYLAFAREGRSGIWSGVNSQGVTFGGADAYTKQEYTSLTEEEDAENLFKKYENVLAGSFSVERAVQALRDYYRNNFPFPDIAFLSDGGTAICLEFSPPDHFAEHVVLEGVFVCTNHFRKLSGAVTQEQNPSTYARLERAEAMLAEDPSFNGIVRMLRDQEHGPTEMSICREAQSSGEYFTQASVIHTVSRSRVNIQSHVVLNGNPRSKSYEQCTLQRG